MIAKTRFGLRGKTRGTYLELVAAFPLVSIKSEEHLEEAQSVMDRLLTRGPLDRGTETYLDALSDLVAAFEDSRCPIAPTTAAEMLRHLMEAREITQARLSRETAIPKSSISAVLAGKKPLSRKMVRTLAGYFEVDAAVLAACT